MIDSPAWRQRAQKKQQESYIDPIKESSAHIFYLGAIEASRLPDNTKYDGMQQERLTLQDGVEIDFGVCTGCGNVVIWQQTYRARHLKRCRSRDGRRRGE